MTTAIRIGDEVVWLKYIGIKGRVVSFYDVNGRTIAELDAGPLLGLVHCYVKDLELIRRNDEQERKDGNP